VGNRFSEERHVLGHQQESHRQELDADHRQKPEEAEDDQ
jgi:hypothetical protein